MTKIPTKKPTSLSLSAAKSIILHHQMLSSRANDTLSIIKGLGYIQIDTISVVERAHHHVLWTRNHDYLPEHLDQLVAEREVFEYWSHAAAYLPMNDYRYSLPLKEAFRKKIATWSPLPEKISKLVLERIKQEGPLKSKDFKDSSVKSSGWLAAKPEKKALERLFLVGALEITRREGFQKVYDLAERVIPAQIDKSRPSHDDYVNYLIDRTLRHHGLATAAEIAYLFPSHITKSVESKLSEKLEAQEINSLKIENIQDTYYCFTKALDMKPRLSQRTTILSPFDNLVIQRKKLKTFFGFDYQIECYIPSAKRKFGYFSLPILKGDRFIGRIDLKADRKERVLSEKDPEN